jgi:hypothetical protein
MRPSLRALDSWGFWPAGALRFTAGYASCRRCATIEKQKLKLP